MTVFNAEAVLSELKGFQRDAVDHVIHRFYGSADASRRFLVADETGLGKSVVARGVIARTIEQLQHDDTVDRIDVVYICSNTDLAQQNLQRLNVTGNPHLAFTSRLTLLALESRRLGGTAIDGKVVNLVSFTPGTSFNNSSWRTGSKEERALLHVILNDELQHNLAQSHASRLFFQGTVRTEKSFSYCVEWIRRVLDGPVHEPILTAFRSNASSLGLLARYQRIVDDIVQNGLPTEMNVIKEITAELRGALARASVETLEPDLVILDEFQRFSHLLDPETGGDAAELAHHLFDYGQAKVLLLSATPYKAYTAPTDDSDDDHYTDFIAVLSFLAGGATADLSEVKRLFEEYRAGIAAGALVADIAASLRIRLLRWMSRTERPQLGADGMLRERHITSALPSPANLIGFAGLQRLAQELDAPISVEYWKSIPYFGNFMENYQVSRALDKRLEDAESAQAIEPYLAGLDTLDAEALCSYEPVRIGYGHIGSLAEDMLESGLWKLLWLPPSMPYFEPGGPFAERGVVSATKRLVFSTWTATPTAIASLLSYEAERLTAFGSTRLTRNTAEARKNLASRLNWATVDGRANAMSTLALFWPHPALALQADPLDVARRHAGMPVRVPALAAEADVQASFDGEAVAGQAWQAYFSTPGMVPTGLTAARVTSAMESRGAELPDDESQTSAGLRIHVDAAFDAGQAGDDVSHEHLARLALHSPGNIAYRALSRLRTIADATTDAGLWSAAALLSNGLRSLFNRLETTLLLDQLYSTGEAYWLVVLRYCADGNLQASMDEYLFQLRSETGGTALTDEVLLQLAGRAYDAVTLRPSTYRARDLADPTTSIPFTARFALRYGGKQQETESARQPEIRNAFNSPFWPFVLASTSVGQEGIDFHWWSHEVLHWNLPSNPVDFEQREGRVNRFAGHAVRKNIAAEHWRDVVASSESNPWKVAFDAAQTAHPELGEFAPYWLYPGASKVERQIITYPLSRDIEKVERLKDALTLYRLTLGQPRQQDMLEMMQRRGVNPSQVAKLDLSPPVRDR
ncbi:helicase-related protein [Cryobacterium sp. Y50]|uniref:helicase-related protein n=1 Tax=Cryobacterium sp. Y50 TaxID=2048286 RepID=UPI000CE3841F|nr:helicase-related protein [Cryobacterium sp. Y50]